jgi:hypothetical protein
MYIHFEDWTTPFNLALLDKKGICPAKRIIKVYPTYQDPRELINKQSLAVIESDHLPFRVDEAFSYKGRELSYSGNDLEAKLYNLGLGKAARDAARSIFRFANKKDTGFCQAAMTVKTEGGWLFSHPLESIDGVKSGSQIHFDVFDPALLIRLGKFVNIDDTRRILGFREHKLLDSVKVSLEGRRINPER